MATSVTMPQLGETVVEGTVIRWYKAEGERVERDEPLFEISTDKVDTEVPSPVAGVLAEILVKEGETVSVGTELARIEEDGAAPAKEAAPAAEAPAEAPPAAGEAAAVEAPRGEAPPPHRQPGVPAPRPARAPAAAGPRAAILSPIVRRLAEEHGIDLSEVQGTGTGGRITKRDVLSYIEARTQAPEAAPAPPPAEAPPPLRLEAVPTPVERPAAEARPREEAVPLSHIRKAIAKHMVESLRVSARAWNMVEVNMENVVRVRERAKDAFREREGFSLTYMPFVARAVCDALLAFPHVNSELRGEELIVKRYVNLGIAVSYEDGLIVPVVKGADTMNLVGLARAINDVAVRARAKKLLPDEVHGGTFTITNPGPFGSMLSVPIINQPQCGILAFDAIEKRPVVIEDAIAIRHMVYLSLSWDHRIIDGALAAQFLARLKQNLETWDFAPEVGLPAGS